VELAMALLPENVRLLDAHLDSGRDGRESSI
jgi:hypothetical protein